MLDRNIIGCPGSPLIVYLNCYNHSSSLTPCPSFRQCFSGSASSDCQSSGFVVGMYILLNEEFPFQVILSTDSECKWSR